MLTAIVSLTGYRIPNGLAARPHESLCVAMLMHAALTSSMMIVQPSVAGAAQIAVAISAQRCSSSPDIES